MKTGRGEFRIENEELRKLSDCKRQAPNSEAEALYVHIPFCEAKCRYCGFYSEPIANHDSERLISSLIKEMARYGLNEEIRTVYIGGGSPSCLPAEQLFRLVRETSQRCPFVEEFTIEVNPPHGRRTSPGQTNEKMLNQLRQAGVNRLSIGAQSFNQNELDFLGRGHTVGSIEQAVKEGRQAGFENISLDLIFAIPGSTLKSWEYSLKSAIGLGVEHISAYSLTYEEGTPLQKAVESGEVVPLDEETDRRMYETAIDELAEGGFEQYEISNFARRGFECRHNLTYWENRPYIGIGPGASSYRKGVRSTNIADIKKYIELIETDGNTVAESQVLSPVEIACETAVLNLRRRSGIDLEGFERRTGFDVTELFAEPIGRYKKLGLLGMDGGRVFLTRKALPIADSVLCDFSSV